MGREGARAERGEELLGKREGRRRRQGETWGWGSVKEEAGAVGAEGGRGSWARGGGWGASGGGSHGA